MKHLKTYSQIFEAEKVWGEVWDLIDQFLSHRVTFPELYKEHTETWINIIDGVDWENHVAGTDDGESDLSKEEYESYLDRLEKAPTQQKNFNYFMASIHGFGDWYHEGDIESQIQDKPIEWYEQEFGQTLAICKMMKALADEDTSLLDPGFVQI